MIFQEDIVLTGQLIHNLDLHMSGERPEGVHVSDLIMCLRKAVARRNGYVEEPSPSRTLLFAMGRAVQAYLTGAVEDAPPVELDGIWGTPDQLMDGLPVEYKATYGHPGWGPSDHYFQQLASYCKAQGVTEGWLVVEYIDGYKAFPKPRGFIPPPGYEDQRPVLKVWRVVFTQGELDAWWDEMLDRKFNLEWALMEHPEETLTIAQRLERVPLSEHWTWECTRCPLKGDICPGGEGTYDRRRLAHDG